MNKKGDSIDFFKGIGSNLLRRSLAFVILVSCFIGYYIFSVKTGFSNIFTTSLIPFGVVAFVLLMQYSATGFYTLYALQFILVMMTMFVDVKLGVATLSVTTIIFLLYFMRHAYSPMDFSQSRNKMLYLFLGFGVFCVLELANPNSVIAAWNIAMTHYVVYPVICAILIPITIKSKNGIIILLMIWSIFVLVASFKGYWQKNHGFNERELYFLYVQEGARTHLISTGIRYFSCFTDAANFGVHMGMATICFGISLFYVKNYLLKFYFLIVILAAIYGMGISGTRSAIFVPVGGLLFFIILIKNKWASILSIFLFIALFSFFRFTTIGNGVYEVRRMRTAFNPTEDASYQLRIENRKKMNEFMVHKPLGYGLGLSKGERFSPKERIPYPPDSWLVSVWVETGIIGLLLYLITHGILFIWCSLIVMFKIKDKNLKGLLIAWLCMNGGFFISAYSNDVMQYPNTITIYTGFALCFAGWYIEKKNQNNIKTKA